MTDFRLFFTQSKQAPLRKNYALVHSPHRRPAVLPGPRFSGLIWICSFASFKGGVTYHGLIKMNPLLPIKLNN
jgi:hypothetical protein